VIGHTLGALQKATKRTRCPAIRTGRVGGAPAPPAVLWRSCIACAFVALLLGCAAAPPPRVARASLGAELPPPVTVPGQTRDCLAIESAQRLDGALAAGMGGATVALAGLAVSDKLPASWTPWLVVSGAATAVASQVFVGLHGDDQARARQCVEDAHERALQKITSSLRGAP